MRVVVIGGYGNFGARVCRALAPSPAMEVVAAGRHPEKGQGGLADLNLQHARLDHSEHDFPRALARLAPGLLIHCAGPSPSLGYAGRRFKWRSGGAWRDAWGWQELKRMRFYGLGARWAAACDVPDLELFPKRYPGVLTMEFRASLESTAQQLALWLAALLRRRGMARAIQRPAEPRRPDASRVGGLRGRL